MRNILFVAFVVLVISCNDTTHTTTEKPSGDTTVVAKNTTYKSISFVDSFRTVHDSDITKSSALKQEYEEQCTKHLLPLIKGQGLYDDLPFEFVTSTKHEGTVYGNFVYDDHSHFVKVQCTIKPELLKNLQEGNKYNITFKTLKLEEGVSFGNTSTDLPTIYAALVSATPIP